MMRKLGLTALALVFVATGCRVASDGRCEIDDDCAPGAQCVDKLCEGGEPPVASVAAPTEARLDELVTLDASATARKDGTADGLAYEWKLLSPQGATFEGAADGAKVVVRASEPHAAYKVEFVAKDRGTPSTPVVHEFKVVNSVPVANLGAAPEVWTRNTEITFDASASKDADGDELSFAWTLLEPANFPGELVPQANGKATLRTGATAAKYKVQVVVSDGFGGADTASMSQTLGNAPPKIEVTTAESVPHACAATNCVAEFVLSARVTDVDGTIDTDSVVWSLKGSRPEVSVAPTVVEGEYFKAGVRIERELDKAIVGTYEFQLVAKDNDGDESRANVAVTVTNRAPTISFTDEGPVEVHHSMSGNFFTASVTPKVVVDDPEGDPMTIEFLEVETDLPGATVTRSTPSDGNPATYTLKVAKANPASLIDGTTPLYSITAKVTDINGATAQATLPVVVKNRAPTISNFVDIVQPVQHSYGVNANFGAAPGYWATFTTGGALVADPDSDAVTLTWSVAGGPAGTKIFPTTSTSPQNVTVFSTNKDVVMSNSLKVTVTAKDVFGAAVTKTIAVRMANSPPVFSNEGLLGGVGAQTVGHEYRTSGPMAPEGTGFYYTFELPPNVVTDANSNELQPLAWSLVNGPSSYTLTEVYEGTPAVLKKLRVYSSEKELVNVPMELKVSTADVFGAAAEKLIPIKIGNRAPRIVAGSSLRINGNTGTSDVKAWTCGGKKDGVSACGTPPPGELCMAIMMCPSPQPNPPNPRNVVWGTGHSNAPETAGPTRLTLAIDVVDDDGDPITTTFGSRSCEGSANGIFTSNNENVATCQGAPGASVACQASPRYGFSQQFGKSYTHREKLGTVTAVARDPFGVSSDTLTRKVEVRYGAGEGGTIACSLIDPGGPSL